MGSVEVRIGFFAGIISIVVFGTELYLGLNETSWGTVFEFAIFFILGVAAYLTVKEKRETEGGNIRFGKAFTAGLYTCFLIALMMGAFSFIFTKYINPHMTEQMVQRAKQIWEEQNLSAEKIKSGMENIRTMYSPKGQLTMTVGTTMLYSLFISLVVALFMSKRKMQQS